MHTRSIIITIASVAFFVSVAIVAAVVWWFGPPLGISISVAALATCALAHAVVVRPYIVRRGATRHEVAQWMPGDDLIPGAGAKTCAINVATTPENVWPWLVQIGFGRAGWYSYDWIDNDGKPSADRIVPEFQSLAPGDRIQMTPDLCLVVTHIKPRRSIVSASPDGSMSWCLALYSFDRRTTRLVSRWRLRPGTSLAAALFMPALEVGGFLMERKMLLGIRERAEKERTSLEGIPVETGGG